MYISCALKEVWPSTLIFFPRGSMFMKEDTVFTSKKIKQKMVFAKENCAKEHIMMCEMGFRVNKYLYDRAYERRHATKKDICKHVSA